jgi:hypothetical protein
MTDEVLEELLSGDADLEYLIEVIKVRSKSALLQCEVGQDLRARAPFFPGSTVTGRCASGCFSNSLPMRCLPSRIVSSACSRTS